jgi:hypothetical protein
MLKYLLLIVLLFPSLAFAAKKECGIKPSYNITISKESVHIFNNKNDLTIALNGNTVLNEKSATLTPALQKDLIQFQKYLRQQLPLLEQQSVNMLTEIKDAFDEAIKNKLGDDSELKDELNKLHKRLVKLLHSSIMTEGDNTRFSYQNFNTLKKDGEKIGRRIFYNVVGSSILGFNFFKNFGAVKDISKNEWKAQKPKLKVFDAHICNVITDVDKQYQQILTELHQLPDK